jgi:type VI secretion system protein ImpL
MKQLLLKIFKFSLFTVALLLGLIIIFGLTLLAGWPWWVGFFVLIGIIGLVIIGILLKKIWLRRREQQFVNQVIEQDDHYLKQLKGKDREHSRELQQRWKEAIDALKHSHLKKHGNPLYVLPWYLIIGESGSGKTTAIQSARLSSPFAEVQRISGISGTRNCDWWFFEQAILIDTAGRYAIPVNEDPDKEEWQKFLALLSKYRRKEPLNGLVVTVPADKLVEADPHVLEKDGKNIRSRIHELMLVLGAKFPVYVMVTKCDRIQGMNPLCNLLSETSLKQAMGHANHEQSSDSGSFLHRSLLTISERLKNIRLLALQKSSSSRLTGETTDTVDPRLLLFPEEFGRLEPGLAAFVRGAFEENPYQENPTFRGIYFSSGRQEGSPYSHFLKELGLIGERDLLPDTNKGLFLHDFFSKIIPADRELFTPTRRALSWHRLTQNMGLIAWVTVGMAVCGLLSYAFAKNLWTLRDISKEFSSPPVLQGELLSDLTTMEQYRNAIEGVITKNERWWFPRFGLNQSKQVEIRLKNDFCGRFREFFLKDFDRRVLLTVSGFTGATPDELLGLYLPYLVRRINLLNSRLSGQGLDELRAMPQPDYDLLAPMVQQVQIPVEIKRSFEKIYLYYLWWNPDKKVLNEEGNSLRSWLQQILSREDTNLKWLIVYVNADPGLSGIQLSDFWSQKNKEETGVFIPAAFTLDGKKAIDGHMDEISRSLADSLILAPKKEDFYKWYAKAYIGSWEHFCTHFPEGLHLLKDRKAHQWAASVMATDGGPYFSLISQATDQIRPITESMNRTNVPKWVGFLYALEEARNHAVALESAHQDGFLEKTTEKGKTLIKKLEQKTGISPANQAQLGELESGKAFYDYRNNLKSIAPSTTTQETAFLTLSEIFKQNSVTGEAGFYKALNALNRLKLTLPQAGVAQQPIERLIDGPLDYFSAYLCLETACHLQSLWEKDVLVEIQGISDVFSLNQILFGNEGYAVRFAQGPAEPFVSRSLSKGFYAKNVSGLSISFNTEFLDFLTRGALTSKPLKENYSVTVVGLPTDANRDARIQPQATRIELQCAGEAQVLTNRNYRIEKVFKWSPESCGDVEFQIEVGNLTLTRKYTGYQAFPTFLQEFAAGQRTFYPSDFPESSAALERLGIRSIKVTYELSGQQPIIDTLGAPMGEVPKNIARCWEQ